MDNKNSHHYRYKSITSAIANKIGKNRCSSTLKYKLLDETRTMTNYKSIRGTRKQIRTQKNVTQRNIQTQSNELKLNQKQDANSKLIGHELIEIAKMKLHSNSPDKARVKTQMTMNRDQFQYFLKKKKPNQFTMSRSLQEIRKMFPKRIDVFINQLKLKAQQAQNNIQKKGQTRQRPITAAKTKKYIMRGVKRYETKNVILIETTHKNDTKEKNFLTQYQVGDVSGWQVQPINEQFIRNTQIQKQKTATDHQ